jgi:protoheme IX farnesyltransferase
MNSSESLKSELPQARVASSRPTQTNSLRKLGDYVLLTKPVIVGLLLATTLGAMLVAQRGLPSLSLLFISLLGGAMTAGGASALNSYFDRDIDPLMGRTSRRPLSTGRISPREALVFGLLMVAGGTVVFALLVNLLSAILALFGAFYYAVLYTLVLKRRTPQNVVIGGAAGAIPPLVGWAAVTNEVNLLAVYLFLIIFYWTPPHTWALMLMVRKDYERVHVPMMPVARGEPETRRQIVLYSLLMVAITLIPFSLRDLGIVYLATALVLGARFLHLALRLSRDGSKHTARKLYYYSNAYLALLFLAMVLDQSALRLILK